MALDTTSLVQNVLDSSTEYSIIGTDLDGVIILELRVAKDDVGKVIGRQGRIARALRTIVRAGAARSSYRVLVEIVD